MPVQEIYVPIRCRCELQLLCAACCGPRPSLAPLDREEVACEAPRRQERDTCCDINEWSLGATFRPRRMCDTQSRARKGTCEGGVPTEGAASRGCAASSSRASPACRPQPKHPYGRRNTYISSYTRHGLGFATADRDESLTTTKFRDLPLRERRLYTLTLGYGLRDDDKGGVAGADRCQRQSQMSRGRAVALMARLHEMLLHGGRTVEGIFSALGVDTRCCYSRYRPCPCYSTICRYQRSDGSVGSLLGVDLITLFERFACLLL